MDSSFMPFTIPGSKRATRKSRVCFFRWLSMVSKSDCERQCNVELSEARLPRSNPDSAAYHYVTRGRLLLCPSVSSPVKYG